LILNTNICADTQIHNNAFNGIVTIPASDFIQPQLKLGYDRHVLMVEMRHNASHPRRRRTSVTTPEIIDQIHELILEDHRISDKSRAEQLGMSRERVGSITHEDLDMRKLSAKWVPKCPNAYQKRQRCQSFAQLLEFFRRDPNDFLPRLVTMDETWLYHYDPETKQQSMEWRHSGLPRPKNSECKNLLGKLTPRFFGIKTASPSLIIFQRAKL